MKEQASTIPAPCKHQTCTEVARLIPDSLNPITDSGLPDSLVPSKAGASRKGSRFNLDSFPDAWEAYCKTTRPELAPQAVFEDFRDYWIAKPGKDGCKLDWLATWRKWVRNSALKPKANGANGNQWQFSNQGIETKAREVGISIRPGESYQDVKSRIIERIGA